MDQDAVLTHIHKLSEIRHSRFHIRIQVKCLMINSFATTIMPHLRLSRFTLVGRKEWRSLLHWDTN